MIMQASTMRGLGLVGIWIAALAARGGAWGSDGHHITCMIAEPLLSSSARAAIHTLLPNGDFVARCTWPDEVRRSYKYRWSAPLHFIDTPDHLCGYDYKRDCHNTAGVRDVCCAGAINNYTSQLQTYQSSLSSSAVSSSYNLTEALMFLSHFVGDIHQPLHVGFTGDLGGNTIVVHWYTRKSNLHHVWDTDIINTAEDRYYDSDISVMANAIRKNITNGEAANWRECDGEEPACPDRYAEESIKAACAWAYKDVSDGSTLTDAYFDSRFPIVTRRLAQGGVRLAAILNTIFQA